MPQLPALTHSPIRPPIPYVLPKPHALPVYAARRRPAVLQHEHHARPLRRACVPPQVPPRALDRHVAPPQDRLLARVEPQRDLALHDDGVVDVHGPPAAAACVPAPAPPATTTPAVVVLARGSGAALCRALVPRGYVDDAADGAAAGAGHAGGEDPARGAPPAVAAVLIVVIVWRAVVVVDGADAAGRAGEGGGGVDVVDGEAAVVVGGGRAGADLGEDGGVGVRVVRGVDVPQGAEGGGRRRRRRRRGGVRSAVGEVGGGLAGCSGGHYEGRFLCLCQRCGVRLSLPAQVQAVCARWGW